MHHRVWVGLLSCAALLGCDEPASPPPPPPNRAPTLDSLTFRPARVAPGHPVLVTVHATDANGDALSIDYEPDAGRIVGSGSRVTWLAPEALGPCGISVRVRDGRGGVANGRSGVSVVPPTLVVGELWALDGNRPLWGTMILLYRSYRDYSEWRYAQAPTVVQSAGFDAAFVVDVLEPGTYWIDAWQDSNGNGCFDGGDRYGVYRDIGHVESIVVQESQTVDVGQIDLRLSHVPPCDSARALGIETGKALLPR